MQNVQTVYHSQDITELAKALLAVQAPFNQWLKTRGILLLKAITHGCLPRDDTEIQGSFWGNPLACGWFGAWSLAEEHYP